MLSEISQSTKDRYHIFTNMWNLRNLTEDHGGGKGGKKLQRGREPNHKRLLRTENKLRVDGGWGRGERGVMGREEGTCWDEHWVSYGNQFDNKIHIKKKSIAQVEREQVADTIT